MAEETYEVDEILDEFLKKQRGVKDTLKEMKNISELMVDLAYSAILYNNDELAEEVHSLEEEMNKLRYQIEIGTMLAARNPEQAADLEGILRVAAVAERISNAARDLAELVLRDIELHPALRAALEEANEIVTRIVVADKSKLIGDTVKHVRTVEKFGMDVIAIRREGEWILDVSDTEKIKAGDTLIANGFKESVKHFQKLAK